MSEPTMDELGYEHCPFCKSKEVVERTATWKCRSCGMTWMTPALGAHFGSVEQEGLVRFVSEESPGTEAKP